MNFSSDFAEQLYPDLGLRKGALGFDDVESLEFARQWVEATDVDGVAYAQHRLIAAMMRRHHNGLSDLPNFARYRTVERQVWIRQRVNLSLLQESLPQLMEHPEGWCFTGNLSWIAKDAVHVDPYLDIVHLLVETFALERVVNSLCKTGWVIAAVQQESWRENSIIWLSKGATGKLWVYTPNQLSGVNDGEISSGVQEGLIGDVVVPTPDRRLSTMIAIAQTVGRHSLPEQWLFDFHLLARDGFVSSDLTSPLNEQWGLISQWISDQALGDFETH